MRDRHLLSESTYGALLEMALLADEREVPWSKQVDMIAVVNTDHYRQNRLSGGRVASEQDGEVGSISVVGDGGAPSMWWDCQEAQDASDSRAKGLVLDDTQRIRNMLPLVLILQHLPTMGSSVQVLNYVILRMT